MRKKFIAGNWKMFKDSQDVDLFLEDVKGWKNNENLEIGICPPFIHLVRLNEELSKLGIKIFAQNVYFEKEGAFTGEISVDMLKSANISGAIVGHSERRNIFGEDDQLINKKVKALVKEGLVSILCVGESLEERENNKAFEVVKLQLEKGLQSISEAELKNVVVAYEPIWAIGTGKVATPEEAEEMCSFIREEVSRLYNEDVANNLIIQYGGSVNDDNAKELLRKPNIDGALVGGASLDWKKFYKIISWDR